MHALWFYYLVFSFLCSVDDLCINHTTKNVIGIETIVGYSGKNNLDTKLTPKMTKTNTTASFTVRAFLHILDIITLLYCLTLFRVLHSVKQDAVG